MGAINNICDMGVVGLDVEATTDDGSREHSCLAVSETEVSLFLCFFFFFSLQRRNWSFLTPCINRSLCQTLKYISPTI